MNADRQEGFPAQAGANRRAYRRCAPSPRCSQACAILWHCISEAWYNDSRQQWKPEVVQLLLIGESAPDPGAEKRRFFYAPTLDHHDSLFRGVVAALYEPIPRGSTGMPKQPWLERPRTDRVYLVDLVPFPVDKLTPGERRRAHREHVPLLVEQARALARGRHACHVPTFTEVAPAFRAAGLQLLHDEPLPFPLGNTRGRFITGVRAALVACDRDPC